MPKAQNFFCRSFPDSCRVNVNFESNISGWQPLNLNMCFMYKSHVIFTTHGNVFKIHVKFSITCLAACLLVSIYISTSPPLAFSLITISFRLAGGWCYFYYPWKVFFKIHVKISITCFASFSFILAGWRDNFDFDFDNFDFGWQDGETILISWQRDGRWRAEDAESLCLPPIVRAPPTSGFLSYAIPVYNTITYTKAVLQISQCLFFCFISSLISNKFYSIPVTHGQCNGHWPCKTTLLSRKFTLGELHTDIKQALVHLRSNWIWETRRRIV